MCVSGWKYVRPYRLASADETRCRQLLLPNQKVLPLSPNTCREAWLPNRKKKIAYRSANEFSLARASSSSGFLRKRRPNDKTASGRDARCMTNTWVLL